MAASLTPLGNEQSLDQLRRLWAQGRGPRTLLFAGPESVGRRQAARWLAAYVNCQADGQRPCGRCRSCQLMLAGTHPDYKEVLPALTTGSGRAKRSSEIRIDQLVPRQRGEPEPLGPWLLTRPTYKVRVGLIDHAEAMNPAAANSLLKLLEEPPAWALIILIAPGPEAVLPTVASRASTFRFRPVDSRLLAGLPAAEAVHPAVRLGQPGLLFGRPEGDNQGQARRAAQELLEGVSLDLVTALSAAEAFAKEAPSLADAGQQATPFAWLRELLRLQLVGDDPATATPAGARRYAAALQAIDDCEQALASYAQAPLACAVLALQLRQLLD
jgi:hypothetical protein